ncbi:hypothetical protein [Chryseobacterium sp. Bi04]|uniref:hypothetical protein n=1 Tax=Chryseobacterium sp. Bi04 TaxID=2822345 RepID=UPI001E45EA22|nr:hypothetical protein [Chryseobacterium sp. Bi04]
MKILQFLFAFNCGLVLVGYTLKSFILVSLRWPWAILFFVISILILRKIVNLRIFQFENSGLVFSIKSYHPLKKGIVSPLVEYPVDYLRSLKIERSVFVDVIVIDIDLKEKETPFRIKIKVSDISDNDYRRMVNSFLQK